MTNKFLFIGYNLIKFIETLEIQVRKCYHMSKDIVEKDKNSLSKDKEVDIMPTALKIINDEKVFAEKMKIYVEKLERQARDSEEQAKQDAKKALRETGVIDKNGTIKKKIVSWE